MKGDEEGGEKREREREPFTVLRCGSLAAASNASWAATASAFSRASARKSSMSRIRYCVMMSRCFWINSACAIFSSMSRWISASLAASSEVVLDMLGGGGEAGAECVVEMGDWG